MKKIILIFVIFLSYFFINLDVFGYRPDEVNQPNSNIINKKSQDLNIQKGLGSCDMGKDDTIGGTLKNCLSDSPLVGAGEDDLKLDGGFKNKIQTWTKNIALFLGILSVGAIVLSAFMMTISAGEDEKITKGKNIFKWAILGLLGVILASSIITLIVNFIYGLA